MNRKALLVAIGLFAVLLWIAYRSEGARPAPTVRETPHADPPVPVVDQAQVEQEAAHAAAIDSLYALTREREQIEGEKILKGMTKRVDKFEGVNWYYPKAQPLTKALTCLYIYIGEKDGRAWGRVLVNYAGRDWLFVKSATVGMGKWRFPMGVEGEDWKRDHAGGKVWEWQDYPLTEDNQYMFETIAGNDQEAILRFSGDTYTSDHTLSARERNALRESILALKSFR